MIFRKFEIYHIQHIMYQHVNQYDKKGYTLEIIRGGRIRRLKGAHTPLLILIFCNDPERCRLTRKSSRGL